MNNITSYIQNLLDNNYMQIITSVVTSCLIFLIVWYVNKLLHKFINKIAKKSNLDPSIITIFHNLVSIGMYVLGTFLILDNLDIQISSLLSFVGLLSVGAGLALQKIVGNIASGMFVLIYKPFVIGDYISCTHPNSKFEGKITDIDLRTTTVVYENNKILIPNQILYEAVITVAKPKIQNIKK